MRARGLSSGNTVSAHGRQANADAVAQRIISLAPHATELAFAAGMGLC